MSAQSFQCQSLNAVHHIITSIIVIQGNTIAHDNMMRSLSVLMSNLCSHELNQLMTIHSYNSHVDVQMVCHTIYDIGLHSSVRGIIHLSIGLVRKKIEQKPPTPAHPTTCAISYVSPSIIIVALVIIGTGRYLYYHAHLLSSYCMVAKAKTCAAQQSRLKKSLSCRCTLLYQCALLLCA